MKPFALALTVVVAGLAAIQLVPVARENQPVTGEVPAPDAVRPLLKRACYDCHSNETLWPWYSRVAPVSWVVAHDVKEGREKVNFSEWTKLDATAQAKRLKKCASEIREGEMPIRNYLRAHPLARLTDAEKATVMQWATSMASATAPDSAGAAAPAGEDKDEDKDKD